MLILARPIKLWAIVVALGGTFSTIQALDTSVWTERSASSCSNWR